MRPLHLQFRAHSAHSRFRPQRRLAILILAALGLAGPFQNDSRAQTPQPAYTAPVNTKETALDRIKRMVAKINQEASTEEGEAAVKARLSQQLRCPPDTLEWQRTTWGVGYGEIAMVHGFAKASKKKTSPGEVYEMRRSGMEWEAIAKNLGVKVDAVASKMTKSAAPPPTPKK